MADIYIYIFRGQNFIDPVSGSNFPGSGFISLINTTNLLRVDHQTSVLGIAYRTKKFVVLTKLMK